MSVKATTWVWENSEASGNARLVLLAIADAADQQGANAWPSQNTIASMCRLSVRTVRRLVADLVTLGELEVVEHGGAAYREDRRPHRYRLAKMPGGTGGHSDPPLPPRPPTGGQKQPHGRTNETPRADTVVPRTSFLDPSFKNPSGGPAAADPPRAQEAAPMSTPDQPALFDLTPQPSPAEGQEDRRSPSQRIVAAYVDSHRAHHGTDPTKRDIGRVARDAAALLKQAAESELGRAATAMGKTVYANLGVQLKIVRKGGNRGYVKGYVNATSNSAEWEQAAADTSEMVANDPELAAWLAGVA